MEFRTADHGDVLLAGGTVLLEADCASCGTTLSTQWSLPSAVAPAEVAAPASAAPAAAPAALGGWRMRPDAPSPAPAEPPAGHRSSDAVDAASLDAYLAQVSARVAAARENLRRVGAELPFAVAPSTGEGSFRAPRLGRVDQAPAAAASHLPAAETAPAADQPAPTGLGRPFEAAPRAASAASAVAAAVASPSFLTDTVDQPAELVEPVLEPALEPSLVGPEPEPFVELVEAPPVAPTPDPVVPVGPEAVPELVQPALEAADPAPAAALVPLFDPEADELSVAVAEAPPLAEAHAGVAPTHEDVFPPQAPLAEPAPPAQPAPAAIAPQSPEASGFWGAATAAAPAAIFPEADQVADDAPAGGIADETYDDGSDSFADAFAHAAASTPAMQSEPDMLPDASVAFEPDRGFDWTGLDEEPRRTRRKRRARRDRSAAKGGVAVDGPAVEPVVPAGPDASAGPRAAVAPRSPIWFAQVVLVLLLAVLSGVAGMKIMTNRDVLLQVPQATANVAPPVIEPATTEPVAGTDAAVDKPAAAPKSAGKRKAAAKAPPRRGSGERVPKIAEPAAAPGATAGHAGDDPFADAAAGAEATPKEQAQVRAGAADTAVVKATAAAGSSNPFDRP